MPVFPKGWFITRLLGMLDLKHSSFGNVQLLHSFVLKMGVTSAPVLDDMDLHTLWVQVIFPFNNNTLLKW